MSVRNIAGTEEGWAILDAAVDQAKRSLGDGLVSAYAIGSLAHGGFRAWVSDVDVALLTGDLDNLDVVEVVETITSSTKVLGELGARLSIFYAPWSQFADPPATSRFPAIDRYDLMRYGVPVHGSDVRDLHGQTPTPQEIREQAVESALRRLTLTNLKNDVQQLEAGGVTVRDATKLVLWPVRLQHVCDTGQATGNSGAVAHYTGSSDARYAEIVTEALRWRDKPTLPDPGNSLAWIQAEIRGLHAEIFQRVARQHTTPRRDELAARAAEFNSYSAPRTERSGRPRNAGSRTERA